MTLNLGTLESRLWVSANNRTDRNSTALDQVRQVLGACKRP